MCSETTKKIKAFSTDAKQANALLALLDYYDRPALINISEQEGLAFLAKLESGEIKI
jgi:hypothetical protein